MNIPFLLGCLSKLKPNEMSIDCGGLVLLRTGLILDIDVEETINFPFVSLFVAYRDLRAVGYAFQRKGKAELQYGGFYALVVDRSNMTMRDQKQLYEDESVIATRFGSAVLLSAKKHLVLNRFREQEQKPENIFTN